MRSGAIRAWLGLGMLLAVAAGFAAGRYGASTVPTSSEATGRVGAIEAEIETALRATDPVERAWRVGRALRSMRVADASRVGALLDAKRDEWTHYEVRLLMWAWAQADPPGALAEAIDWSPHMRAAATYVAARAWARADPLAAQQALALARGWIESEDFDGALAFVQEHFRSIVTQEDLVDYLMQQMVERRGLDATFRWAEAARDRGEERRDLSILFRKAARAGAAKDPGATSRWLDEVEGHPSYLDRARRAAAVVWGRADAPAALAWLLAQAPGSRRHSGIVTVISDWHQRDPEALAMWLSQRADSGDPDIEAAVAKIEPSEGKHATGSRRNPMHRPAE
jgi:hypothetical protein